MKCEFCGTEYELYHMYAYHEINKDCPLSDTHILQDLVERINEAIKRARMKVDIHDTGVIMDVEYRKKEYYCTVWCPDCCGQDFHGCFDGGSEKHGPFDTFKEADVIGKKKCSTTIYEYEVTEE